MGFDLEEKEPAPVATGTSPKEIIHSDDNTILTDCQANLEVSAVCAEAQAKIEAQFGEIKKPNKHAAAVSKPVADVLKLFCGQNDEFSQAVVQSEKTLADCIAYTVKGCGQSISDIEVYKRAVQFYFEGADVHMKLTLDLGDEGFSDSSERRRQVEFSLDSLLDF